MNAPDRTKAAVAMVKAMRVSAWYRGDLYAYARSAGLAPGVVFEVAAHAETRGWIVHRPAREEIGESWNITGNGLRRRARAR